MNEVCVDTIGEAWLEACRCIFEKGSPMRDEDKDLRELMHFMLSIRKPSMQDQIVEAHGSKEMIAWMDSNFTERKTIPELKGALSYGVRLFDYNGKDQIRWVIEKLRKKPETKAATIPMLMPDKDEGYVPCVSMLDFKMRDGKLMLVAMCRSIDFGKKVYANMLSLHKVQNVVAEAIGAQCGDLVMYVVSAHIYDDDYETVRKILEETEICARA